MAFVRRANVILEINDESIQYMLDSGFDLVDSHGNLITKSIPFDVTELRRLYIQSLAEIESLKKALAVKEETPVHKEESVEPEAVVKPKRTRKSE